MPDLINIVLAAATVAVLLSVGLFIAAKIDDHRYRYCRECRKFLEPDEKIFEHDKSNHLDVYPEGRSLGQLASAFKNRNGDAVGVHTLNHVLWACIALWVVGTAAFLFIP